MRATLLATVLIASTVGLAGCRHKSKTPEEAFHRFADAVRSGDGGALFDALDQSTRWDLMTIQKAHREAYDIVLSNYPEGPERERERRRYEPEATAPSAREFFKKETAPHMIPTMKTMLDVAGQMKFERVDGDHTYAVTEKSSGADRIDQKVAPDLAELQVRLPFARGQDGGWGYAGLAKQTTEDKNRAYHDLDVVRANAADYERAAARAAK